MKSEGEDEIEKTHLCENSLFLPYKQIKGEKQCTSRQNNFLSAKFDNYDGEKNISTRDRSINITTTSAIHHSFAYENLIISRPLSKLASANDIDEFTSTNSPRRSESSSQPYHKQPSSPFTRHTKSCRPRMVARSSVNNKLLSTSSTSSNTPKYLHTLNSNLRRIHLSQSTETPFDSVPISYIPRPFSSYSLRNQIPMDTSQFLNTDFIGNSSNTEQNLQNIDDLLLRRNRSNKLLDITTNRLQKQDSKLLLTNPTIGHIPLISYQKNVLPMQHWELSLQTQEQLRNNNNTSTLQPQHTSHHLSTYQYSQHSQHQNQPHQHRGSEELSNLFNTNEEKYVQIAKARVELVLIFVKIGQVDTVNERYQADIFLQARWREPLLDARWNNPKMRGKTRGTHANRHNAIQNNAGNETLHKSNDPLLCTSAETQFYPILVENPMIELASKRHLHTLKLQDDEFWNPRLLIDNAQGEPIEIVSHEVEFVEPNFEAYLVEKRRVKGVFHETLELKHFPFDCQDLSVTVTCDRTVDEVELVPSPTEVSQVDRRCAADCQEWKIFHHVDIAPMEIQTGYSPGTSKRRHPGLVFTSRSARRSGYFMVNMVLISCVLCLLSFSAFSVPADENRLQLSLLLLLTTVTFKFAASQNLPKISYLTYLDKVVLVNFFMLVILTVWHAIARALSTANSQFLKHEHFVMYSLLSCYCIGSVVFGLTVYLDAGSRRRMMQRKDVEFIQYKQKIELEKQHQSILAVPLDDWLNSPNNSYSIPDETNNSYDGHDS